MYARQYPDHYHPHFTYVQNLGKSAIKYGSFDRRFPVQQKPCATQDFNEVIENHF